MRKLATRIMLITAGVLLVSGMLWDGIAQAETVNQNPFSFNVNSLTSNVWASPKYDSSTLAGYVCADVTSMNSGISSWIITFYADNGVTKGITLWSSPRQTSTGGVCSPYSLDGPGPTDFYVKVRAYNTKEDTEGSISGVADVYTDFQCGSACGGIEPRPLARR